MKKIYLQNKNNMKQGIAKAFLFLLAWIVTGEAWSQNPGFAPIGAVWYYETQSHFSTGYIKMESEKDTVINEVACVKLVRERHWHDLLFDELHESTMSPLFLSQVGDAVMVYHDNAFSNLFDFGAEIGDSWMVPGQEGVCEEDYGSVQVVGKGVETYNGIELKYVLLVDMPHSYWGFSPTLFEEPSDTIKVVERIGPIGSHLLPEQKCMFDYAEGGVLRCYIDDELGELHLASLNPERNCDYISNAYQGVDKQYTFDPVSVSPNPCVNKIRVSVDVANFGHCRIALFNALGKRVFFGSFTGNETNIDMEGLPSGLYCLAIDNGSRIYSKSFIKK